jgi:hypothetical protein
MRKVQIAIPSYNGEIGAATMQSVLHAMREAEAAGWEARLDIRPRDSFPPRARNHLVQNFLDSDSSDMVFWDADIATTPGAFTALLSHDVDVVGGVYRLRQEPERYPVRPLPGGALEEDPATGLIEVEGIATGFLRISRAAILRTIAHFPDLWADERGRKVPWLFDYEIREHKFWSEDYVFCARFRAAGGRVFADPALAFVHTGPQDFIGAWARELGRRRAARINPLELMAANARVDRWVAEFDAEAAERQSAAA